MSLFHGIIILLICTLISTENVHQCTNGIFKCVSPNSLRVCLTGQLVSSEVFCPPGFSCSESSPTICTNITSDLNNTENLKTSQCNCTQPGLFPIENSRCLNYCNCMKLVNTFIGVRLKCFVGYFDPVLKTCTSNYVCPELDIPKCTSEGKFSIPHSCEYYMLCTKTSNGFQRLVKNCASGSFNPISGECEQNYICPDNVSTEHPISPNVTISFITTTESIQNVQCTKQGIFPVQNTECKKFRLCFLSTNGFEEDVQECSNGSLFDPNSQRCSSFYVCTENSTTLTTTEVTIVDNKTTPIPTCTTPGTFPLSNTSCTKYVVCQVTSHDYSQRIDTCPFGTLFDPINLICSQNYTCSETSTDHNLECKIGEVIVIVDTNCTKYIRCVLSSNGLFQEVVSCLNNTRFDPFLKKCSADYICSENPVTTQRTLDVSKKVTERTTDYVVAAECTERGLFPVPNTNCKSYMKCLVTSNGFSKLLILCPTNTYFDPSIKKCTATYICTDSSTTVNNSIITTTLEPITTVSTIPSIVTKPSSTQCEKQGSFAIPNTDCKIFKICVLTTNGFQEKDLECPEGLLFDPDQQKCSKTYVCSQTTESTIPETTTQMTEKEKCTKPGKIPISGTYCKKYILCVKTILGFIEIEYTCPENTFFNAETQKCVRNYQCSEVEITTPSVDDISKKCKAVGRIPLLGEDCKKYILCSKSINGFKGKVYECPKGYYFEPNKSRCNKFYQCKENTTSTTPIPDTTITTTTTTKEDISKNCTYSGKIPVLGENCKKYILCVKTTTGFKGKIYECPTGTYFDPHRVRCFTTYKCQENIQTTTTLVMASSKDPNEGITSSKTPGDITNTNQQNEDVTSTSVTNNKSTSTSQAPNVGITSTFQTTNEDLTTTAVPNVDVTNTSTESNQRTTTTSEKQNEEIKTTSAIPSEENIRSTTPTPTTIKEDISKKCTYVGKIPVLGENCTKYILCVKTTTGLKGKIYECPKGTYFDPHRVRCLTTYQCQENIQTTTILEMTSSKDLNEGVTTSKAPNNEGNTTSTQQSSGGITSTSLAPSKEITTTSELPNSGIISSSVLPNNNITTVTSEQPHKEVTTSEQPIVDITTTKLPNEGVPSTTTAPNAGVTSTSDASVEGLSSTTTAPNAGMTSTSQVPNESVASTTAAPNAGVTSTSTNEGVASTTTSPKAGVTSTTKASIADVASTTTTPNAGVTTTSEASIEGVASTTTAPNAGVTSTSQAQNEGVASTTTSPNAGVTTTSEASIEVVASTTTAPNAGMTSTSEAPNEGVASTTTATNAGVTSTSQTTNGNVTITSVPNVDVATTSTESNQGTIRTSEHQNDEIKTTSELPSEENIPSTIPTPTTIEEDISKNCTYAGKIPVLEQNCTKYILCVNTTTGMKGKIYECPKETYFDPNKARCYTTYTCQENIQTTTTSEMTSSKNPNEGVTTSKAPNDGNTTSTQQSNEGITSTSIAPSKEITTTSVQPNGGIISSSVLPNGEITTVTTEKPNKEITTSEQPIGGNTTTKLPNEGVASTSVTNNEGTSTSQASNEGVTSTTQTPTTIEEDISKKCTYVGKIPVLGENCTKYILCVNTTTGLKGKIYVCPKGTYFDPNKARCYTTYTCQENIQIKTTSEMTSSKNPNEGVTTSKAPNEGNTSTQQSNGGVTSTSLAPSEGITTTSVQPNGGITTSSVLPNDEISTVTTEKPNKEITTSEQPIGGITTTMLPNENVTSTSVTNNEGTSTSQAPNEGVTSTNTAPNEGVTSTSQTTNAVLTTTAKPNIDVTSTSTESNQGTTTSSATPSTTPITTEEDISKKCKYIGKIPVLEQNCTKYILCVNTTTGMKGKIYECPKGTYFDPNRARCFTTYTCQENIQTNEGKTTSKTPNENITSTEQSTTNGIRTTEVSTTILPPCVANGRMPIPGTNCKKYILCTSTQDGFVSYEYTCPTNSSYNPSINRCSNNYTCENDVQYCETIGQYPDENDSTCKYYYNCREQNNYILGVRIKCEQNQLFNPVLQQCSDSYICNQRSRTPRKTKRDTRFLVNGHCTTVGRYEVPFSNCKNYVSCSPNIDGTLKATNYTCPTTTVFNQVIQKCTSPTSFTCLESFCAKNLMGQMLANPNMKGCTTFITCEIALDNVGNILGNTGVVNFCPQGTKFNPNISVCDQFYTCPN